MADAKPLMQAVADRFSCYGLAPESPIPDSRIIEIVRSIVYHAPSPFNIQSARVVILLKNEHKKLWDIALEIVKSAWPPEFVKFVEPRIASFRQAYGSVLFYEDGIIAKAAQEQHKNISHLIPQWQEHSSGMHHFIAWAALEAEGFGCNLQHYEGLEERLSAEFNIPKEWSLKSQLNFGKPLSGRARERTYKPLEERVFVHGV